MNGVVQEKAASDDPVPEMAACRTDMLLFYTIVYLQYTNSHTHTDILSEIPITTLLPSLILLY